ncbi:MAG: tRNA (adenosine(37)-N6)-threonylcarbamoyltransferase complex dimerization subunit type 1 TsaB [bacterium]|nr:tRNA (adenosine(37)-N6)-threonylcarbamoyltransferase complex dimerization subunit type 1 TsaB [bacterium]
MILGLNTAAGQFGIALLSDEGVVRRALTWLSKHQDSEQLHAIIQTELTALGANFDSLNKIGIANGPGGYTGLRLGILCAKTIAQVQQIPLIAMGTLEAVAAQYRDRDDVYLCLIPGIKGEVNAAMYTTENGVVTELLAPIVWSFTHLSKMLAQFEAPICVCGVFTQEMEQVLIESNNPNVTRLNAPIDPVIIARHAFESTNHTPLNQINPIYPYEIG